MSNRIRSYQKPLAIIAFGAMLLFLPSLLGDYFIHLVTTVLLFGYLGVAWNILGGYAGQFSFGHAAFFGVGAFTSTLFQIHMGVNPWAGMFLAGIAGLLLGMFIGFLTFRYGLRGPYFALAMLALAEMLRVLAVEWMTLKYPLGIILPLKGDSFWDFQFRSKVPYYYIILCMAILVLYLSRIIEDKRIGLYFKAIRENENAAETLGVNTFKYKMVAMAISSFLTAMGGTFYAQYYLTIDEEAAFGVAVSIEILLGPIIGGAGTVFGPILGATILECLSEGSRNLLGAYSGVHLMLYGAILITVIIFLPKGILGGLQTVLAIFKKRR
ncbi:MAG: branched-chain amino acid ABC transporter permease [Deltaproteobacteria bacterium]|nr:branched-chain amino acid ABC transporter permease [Deltaproteobacteria bacterium]MBW2154099.1 branched-chain amino acid ABC transporter permease [Deltaproteobacteria bacterium]